ncbi:MAG: hypothetical protein V4494_01210 [Chlamydiota bacterium]
MQVKALYNLLRYNWLSDSSLEVQPWQIEDLRKVSIEELLIRLEKLEVPLDQEKFLMYAENAHTPEELVDCLFVKEDDPSGFDQCYLLLFELWRRLLPDKQSLSIFCDELDERIAFYDENESADDELVQTSLEELEDILDENVDHGEDPQEVFSVISSYCAHDLESFLYDFIVEQIDAENEMYASELVEGFYEYVADQRWFTFLRVILFSKAAPSEAKIMLSRLLEHLQEDPDFDLLIEIGNYLAHSEENDLFVQTIRQAFQLLEKEGHFQELLRTLMKFYQCCDNDVEFQTLSQVALKRESNDLDAPLNKNDHDFQSFKARLHE